MSPDPAGLRLSRPIATSVQKRGMDRGEGHAQDGFRCAQPILRAVIGDAALRICWPVRTTRSTPSRQ
jgi:hypothetical protein